jgi:hypothetical protein
MRINRQPFWIAGYQIFTAVLYYLIVVPLVFLVLFVPLSLMLSPVVIYVGSYLPIIGATAGTLILLASQIRRRYGRR